MTGIQQLSLMTLAVDFLRSYKVLGHGSFARGKPLMPEAAGRTGCCMS